MPDYHPLDVRYKGPSTAYRGSAKRIATPERAPLAKAPPQKPAKAGKPATPPPRPNGQSPWGTQTDVRPAPARPQRRPAAFGAVGRAFDGVSAVFRIIKYVYFGIIFFAFLFFLLVNGSLFF